MLFCVILNVDVWRKRKKWWQMAMTIDAKKEEEKEARWVSGSGAVVVETILDLGGKLITFSSLKIQNTPLYNLNVKKGNFGEIEITGIFKSI